MKKAIIVLALLSIITLGFCAYEGYLYVDSLNNLNTAQTDKNELVSKNIELEKENAELEKEYNQKSEDLINNNVGCKLWKNQEEALKKITE